MKTILLAVALLGLSACDLLGPMDVPVGVDAGATIDTGSAELPCTEWGIDGEQGGVWICLSHDPNVCQGPWPCD
jgi:hypothetical protein